MDISGVIGSVCEADPKRYVRRAVERLRKTPDGRKRVFAHEINDLGPDHPDFVVRAVGRMGRDPENESYLGAGYSAHEALEDALDQAANNWNVDSIENTLSTEDTINPLRREAEIDSADSDSLEDYHSAIAGGMDEEEAYETYIEDENAMDFFEMMHFVSLELSNDPEDAG